MRAQSKKNILRFNGETPTAINLDHVTTISTAGNKVFFNFQTNQIHIELENEDAAKASFEQFLNIWATCGEECNNVLE